MNTPLDDTALGQLFSQAHSHSNWQEKAISDQVIKQLYELTKLGPTSANCCPARFVFITSDAAKAKPTYPALLGIEGARQHLARLLDEALSALESFDSEADTLRAMADYVVARSH